MSSAERDEIIALRAIINNDQDGSGWEKAWSAKRTPWDGNAPQAALVELVEKRWSQVGVPWPKGGKALVPGCGRGYDCVYLGRHGLETVGQDLAPTGIEAAKQFLAEAPDAPTNVTFVTADFFKSKDEAAYDLCYDYTFLCALPPDMRSTWAKTYARVIKPSGLLVTLMYPLDGDRAGGPPYSLSEELYKELLQGDFNCIYSEVPGESNEGHAGREKMAVWQRK